jgi:phthiocerol/phenolphthiocerol synthesis type-I polyketide synthase D
MAGLIKAVLVLQRGQIPPNLHFSRWNPAIDASATRLVVPTDITPWPQCPGPRRRGVVVRHQWHERACGARAGPAPEPLRCNRAAVMTLVVSGCRPNGARRRRGCWPSGWMVTRGGWPMWRTR